MVTCKINEQWKPILEKYFEDESRQTLMRNLMKQRYPKTIVWIISKVAFKKYLPAPDFGLTPKELLDIHNRLFYDNN